MKKIILAVAVLVALVGCTPSEDTSDVYVPNDSTITLDDNQTIGYKPNTNVQIVNVGEGSYYITCDGQEECGIHIGDIDNSTDDDETSTETTTTTEVFKDTNTSV